MLGLGLLLPGQAFLFTTCRNESQSSFAWQRAALPGPGSIHITMRQRHSSQPVVNLHFAPLGIPEFIAGWTEAFRLGLDWLRQFEVW